MKIYTVYRNKIHDLKVRETKVMFTSEEGSGGLAFGCCRTFRKTECAVTPIEAIEKAIKDNEEKKQVLISKTYNLDMSRKELHKLKKKYLFLSHCKNEET